MTSSALESVLWRHPISGEVSGYNPYLVHTGSARLVLGVMWTATTAFIPEVRVVISYGQVKSCPLSHWLCPVMWLKQPGYVVHFQPCNIPCQLFSSICIFFGLLAIIKTDGSLNLKKYTELELCWLFFKSNNCKTLVLLLLVIFFFWCQIFAILQ